MKANLKLYRQLLAVFMLCTSNLSLALPDDHSQPAFINANHLESDINKGLNIYTGNVVIVQGSIRIAAERVEIFTDKNNEIEKILATSKGGKAQFQQKPAPDKALVKAQSKTIDYRAKYNKIFLIDKAEFEQVGQTRLTGDKIDYDMATSLARASGGQTDGKKNRIQMVIQPKAIDKK